MLEFVNNVWLIEHRFTSLVAIRRHSYTYRDICATHLLRHWSHFVQTTRIEYAPSFYQRHELFSRRADAAIVFKFFTFQSSALTSALFEATRLVKWKLLFVIAENLV